MKTMKKIIDIYLWVTSKTLGIAYQKKGEWWLGVMSLGIPIYFFLLSLSHFICKVNGIEPATFEPLLLSLLITLLLFFYYKKDDRGQKIVEYYDNNEKMNKRSKVCLFLASYYFLGSFIFIGLLFVVDYFVGG